MLEQVSKGHRKELVRAATEFYKSGAEPSPDAAPEHFTRAQVRQAQRALGNRGTKARRANPAKHARAVVLRSSEVVRVVLADEALGVAKQRVEHPLMSRLRRG